MTWLTVLWALLRRYWKPLALAAVVLAYSVVMYQWGSSTQKVAAQFAMASHLAEDAKAQAHAEQAARDTEHKLAAANAAAGEQYEKGKQDAEAAGKRVADDLRAGNLRLRKRWQGCVVSGAASGSGEPVDATEGRADSAGRIIAATHDDAAKIKALQDLLRAERK